MQIHRDASRGRRNGREKKRQEPKTRRRRRQRGGRQGVGGIMCARERKEKGARIRGDQIRTIIRLRKRQKGGDQWEEDNTTVIRWMKREKRGSGGRKETEVRNDRRSHETQARYRFEGVGGALNMPHYQTDSQLGGNKRGTSPPRARKSNMMNK